MSIIVYDTGFVNIIKQELNSNKTYPGMKALFYSGEDAVYYETENFIVEEKYNTVVIIVTCPESEAVRPCTHVIIKRKDNDEVVYKIVYESPLQYNITQVCHIVLRLDINRINDIGYIALPSIFLKDIIEEDHASILAYEFALGNIPPYVHPETGILFSYINKIYLSDLNSVTFNNEIRFISSSTYRIVQENEAFFAETIT